MTSMQTAKQIGLDICERISKKTMRFIDEYDPDLHYELVQERKKRGIKD
jgi:hypothetical protein